MIRDIFGIGGEGIEFDSSPVQWARGPEFSHPNMSAGVCITDYGLRYCARRKTSPTS